MMQMPGKMIICLCLVCMSAVAEAQTLPPVQAVASQKNEVVYNKVKDTVAITAEGAMLSSLLLQIGGQSGINIRMDPKTDAPVTFNTSNMPLERAIDGLTKGLNVLKSYKATGKNSKSVLLEVSILPAGQHDASAAISLLNLDREIGLRAGQMFSQTREGERTQQMANRLAERWQARQGSLTMEQKQRYEAKLKALEENALAKEREREAREKKHQEKVARRLERLPPEARERALRPPPVDKKKLEQARRDFAQPVTPDVDEAE